MNCVKVGKKTYDLDPGFVRVLKDLPRNDSNDTEGLIFFQRQLEFVE